MIGVNIQFVNTADDTKHIDFAVNEIMNMTMYAQAEIKEMIQVGMKTSRTFRMHRDKEFQHGKLKITVQRK